MRQVDGEGRLLDPQETTITRWGQVSAGRHYAVRDPRNGLLTAAGLGGTLKIPPLGRAFQVNLWSEAMSGTAVVPDETLRRIRGEFLEMPGLRLTPAQAQRLWGLDRPTCERLMNTLVSKRFLARSRDGSFVRAGNAA